MVITTLAHHIDLAWMYEAYRQTRKSGAVGVDKVSAGDYAADLEANLTSLLDRFKTGTYYAPPVRRVEIPKGDGSATRPIGIPTFEDKVLQRAWRVTWRDSRTHAHRSGADQGRAEMRIGSLDRLSTTDA
jgi:RNA-directed DNA polymerase